MSAPRSTRTDVVTTVYTLDREHVQTVLGINDENLRVLDNQIDCDIHVRGTRVELTGPAHEVSRAGKILDELQAIARRGHVISPDTVKNAIGIINVETPQSVSEILAREILARRG